MPSGDAPNPSLSSVNQTIVDFFVQQLNRGG